MRNQNQKGSRQSNRNQESSKSSNREPTQGRRSQSGRSTSDQSKAK